MKAPAQYHVLRAECMPHMRGYFRDLLIHDRRVIRRHPKCPFIHVTRDQGTYITMLPPEDSTAYPPAGEQVKYLFGTADRRHILQSKFCEIEYARNNHPAALVHHFDGRFLRRISYDQATCIIAKYKSAIELAWQRHEPV